jgi:polar amino acid transport system substrate-binding protein
MKTEWVPAGFDAIILGVDSGKFDVGVSSFTINAERLQQATMVSVLQRRDPVDRRPGQPEAGEHRQRLRYEHRGAEGHRAGR